MLFFALLLPAISALAMTPVAWVKDPSYEVTEPVGNDGFSENSYPAGQSSKNWTDRVMARRLENTGSKPLNELMQATQSEYSKDCESSRSIDLQEGQKFVVDALYAWLCFRENGTDKGRIEFVKMVRKGDYVYFVVAGGRTPAFSADRIPKQPEARQNIWVSSSARLVACNKLTQIQCVPGEAIFARTPVIQPTPAEQSEIALSISRGRELYRQDHLAWHGSDFAVAKNMVPKEGKGMGFLAVSEGGLAGTFYLISAGKDGKAEADSFHADESGKFTVGAHLDSLPESLAIKLKARDTAAKERISMCSDALNTAVLQHENGKDWWVYMMSATKTYEQVWIGGHARIHVSADGGKVISLEPSTNACLSFNATQIRSAGKNGANPMTQILTAVPSEYHVMQSLTHAVPLVVVTDAGVWRVTGDKIEKFSVDDVKAKK